ncbi:unnamed protein product [Menidia menidia]|uniref:(Atlantic silverside) hypothetical protein n=1 Tax=Menidia menidia TaxID=238744 RepID=A0A8S4AN14_9TELE|nr:unnamed protein product [Menidia menidia]
MEGATSTLLHSYGLGPRGPNQSLGSELPRGPHQATQASSGPPRPEGHHHKPFFYMQPSQPFLPVQSLQWPVPMPVSYNPYYGYSSLGYGLPMMHHYQQNPYMEPPGFIVPHTHLHLMDYRRMLNSQYYQTMAYHSRRFRYQQNSTGKEMTNSEVQTEPLAAAQRPSSQNSNEPSENVSSIPTSRLLPTALVVHDEEQLSQRQEVVHSSTKGTPSNGFLIETEEVRIQCCATPVGLQLLHAHEAAEMSQSFSQDVVQCSSILQSSVLQDQRLHFPEQDCTDALQVCPDILLVGKPSADEKIPSLDQPKNQGDPVTAVVNLSSQEAAFDKAEMKNDDQNTASKNLHLKVVHLPFDPKFLDELRKMESTVWSVGQTLPPPQVESQTGTINTVNDAQTAGAEVTAPEMLILKEDVSTKIIAVSVIPTLPEVEDMVPTEDRPGNETASEGVCPLKDGPVLGGTRLSEITCMGDVAAEPNVCEINGQDHQDTSFESLPAYLPSTNWLSDFDNFYYSRKFPSAPKKQNRPHGSRGLDIRGRRKLDLEYREQPNVHKQKLDRQSLSDHECCISRSFNENLFSPYVSKTDRLCSRCLAKRRICTSPNSGRDPRSLKRKAVPFQQWNDTLLPTCEACKSHSKRRQTGKGSNTDLCGACHGHDTEGDSSGNSSCCTGQKWRAPDESKKLTDLKRPLASKQNLNQCPTPTYPKLREKNCLYDEPHHQPVAQERLHHCPHSNTLQGMDENCVIPVSLHDKWRNMDQTCLTRRLQTGKSWRNVMPNNDISKNECRSLHLNKHKNSQPQAPGTLTKDTRC